MPMTDEQFRDANPELDVQFPTECDLEVKPRRDAVFPVNFWWAHFAACRPDIVVRLAPLSTLQNLYDLTDRVEPGFSKLVRRCTWFLPHESRCINFGTRGNLFKGKFLSWFFTSNLRVKVLVEEPKKIDGGYAGSTTYNARINYKWFPGTSTATVYLSYKSIDNESCSFRIELLSTFSGMFLWLISKTLKDNWLGIVRLLHPAFAEATYKLSRRQEFELLSREEGQATTVESYSTDYIAPRVDGAIQIRVVHDRVLVEVQAVQNRANDAAETDPDRELHEKLQALHIGGRGIVVPQIVDFGKKATELSHELFKRYIGDTNLAKIITPIFHGDAGWISLDVSGESETIPWEMLNDGGRWLSLESCFVRTIQNAPTMRGLKRISRPRGVLLIGADNAEKDNKLKNVRQEIADIKDSLNKYEIRCKPLIGKDATKESVLQWLGTGDYDVLHFSGHSHFVANDVNASHLVLYGDSNITVNDIGELNMKQGKHLPIQLVFLNSCGSAATGADKSSGQTIGLCKLLCTNGDVSCAIGMQHTVDDVGAAALAISFYRSMFIGARLSPAECLRLARIEVKRKLGFCSNAWFSAAMYVM